MKIIQKFFAVGFVFCALILSGQSAKAQNSGNTKEVYNGSLISFNGPRTRTALFTLRINGLTSDEESRQNLALLRDKGQDQLRNSIDGDDLGRFSLAGDIGVPINVVRESVVDGKRRVFVVFARLEQFAELRGGYRSLDYPFGVIEMYIDERTGKGDGTYIAAARIRFIEDKNQIEIENFATYPVKLTNVTLEGSKKRQ